MFRHKSDHVVNNGHPVMGSQHAVGIHGRAHSADSVGQELVRELKMGMGHRGASLVKRAEQSVNFTNVVNGKFQSLSVVAHISSETAGGGGTRINNAIHLAHLGKGLVETVEVFFCNKLTMVQCAFEIDVQDAEIICQDDCTAKESGGGISADTERVSCENTIPSRGGDLKREKDALTGAKSMDLLNTDEMIITGDEGEMTG